MMIQYISLMNDVRLPSLLVNLSFYRYYISMLGGVMFRYLNYLHDY